MRAFRVFDRVEVYRQELERRVLARAAQVHVSDLACLVDRGLLAGGSGTIRLAGRRGEPYTTVLSRYQRAGTPTPKEVESGFRLWLAHRLLSEGFTVSRTAEGVGASSPQAFGRFVRTRTGRTAGAFTALPEAEVWTRYVETVIAPYCKEAVQRAA